MKKRFLLMGAAAVLVMATVVGGSLAADQVSGDQAVQAPLAATNLSIALDGAAEYPIESAWMPGSTIELNGETGIYSVENTGTGDSYIRLTLYTYWGDEDGVNTDFVATDDRGEVYRHVAQVEVPAEMLGDGWVKAEGGLLGQSVDGKQVFYYTKPLATGKSTSALLKGVKLPASLSNQYAGQQITLRAEADGVQFIGADYNDVNADGILSAWGVKATLGADGSIAKIEN